MDLVTAWPQFVVRLHHMRMEHHSPDGMTMWQDFHYSMQLCDVT